MKHSFRVMTLMIIIVKFFAVSQFDRCLQISVSNSSIYAFVIVLGYIVLAICLRFFQLFFSLQYVIILYIRHIILYHIINKISRKQNQKSTSFVFLDQGKHPVFHPFKQGMRFYRKGLGMRQWKGSFIEKVWGCMKLYIKN